MDNKLQLKKMSHKKLRKLCKQLGKEVVELNATLSNLKGEFTTVKQREISWKEQLDAEVYYKNKALSELETTNQIKETAQNSCKSLLVKQSELRKRIEELEHALDALGNQGPTLSRYANLEERKVYVDTNKLGEGTHYIGEIPEELVMGVDGQLKEEDNRVVTPVSQKQINKNMDEAVEWAKRIDMLGSIFGVPTSGKIVPTKLNTEPAKVDETVEWAKRNGHHFPNGKPDRDRMKEVNIPSAEEISQKNQKAFQEMSDRMKHS